MANRTCLCTQIELDLYSFIYSGPHAQHLKKFLIFCILFDKCQSLMFCNFAMSHGSQRLNLDPVRLVLARDMRSRSWPNIDGTYGNLLNPKSVYNDFFPEPKVALAKEFVYWPTFCLVCKNAFLLVKIQIVIDCYALT